MPNIPKPNEIRGLRIEAFTQALREMLVHCNIEEWQPGVARSDWFSRLSGGNYVEQLLTSFTQLELDSLADDFRSLDWEVPIARAGPRSALPEAAALFIVNAPGVDPGPLKHQSLIMAERYAAQQREAQARRAILGTNPFDDGLADTE